MCPLFVGHLFHLHRFQPILVTMSSGLGTINVGSSKTKTLDELKLNENNRMIFRCECALSVIFIFNLVQFFRSRNSQRWLLSICSNFSTCAVRVNTPVLMRSLYFTCFFPCNHVNRDESNRFIASVYLCVSMHLIVEMGPWFLSLNKWQTKYNGIKYRKY